MRVAIVGATGAVGREFLRCLEFVRFPVSELFLFASGHSAGKKVSTPWGAREVGVLDPSAPPGVDLFLFSAGAACSREVIPLLARHSRALIVDNSSAWRMDPSVPLVVPQVNPTALGPGTRLVANPNCSTIQVILAIYRFFRENPPFRLVVTTFQSVSGSGGRAIERLDAETRAYSDPGVEVGERVYPVPILGNLFPMIGPEDPSGETGEEVKMRQESRKILGVPDLDVHATCVRVPVSRGHSAAVTLCFHRPVTLAEIEETLKADPKILWYPRGQIPPSPLVLNDQNRHLIHVGRVRLAGDSLSLSLFVVADNLWVGAALNAVEIALASGVAPASPSI